MSVSRLLRLLETGQYHRCLEEAAVLSAEGGHGSEGAARIEAAVCRSCLALTDYHCATQAGERAAALAREAGDYDLLGAVLVDLGAALGQTRRLSQAESALREYLDGLPACTAARCMEGIALQRLAGVVLDAGRSVEALTLYERARQWHSRFGDDASVRECVRAMFRLHLRDGRHGDALRLLAQQGETGDCDSLLDWAEYLLAVGRWGESANAAMAALDLAGGEAERQCRAQLLLCRTAGAQGCKVEALEFALAARVTAIDGRLYALEFEAADLLFGLLRQGGAPLMREVAADFDRQGVNVYHYLSDEAVRRQFS